MRSARRASARARPAVAVAVRRAARRRSDLLAEPRDAAVRGAREVAGDRCGAAASSRRTSPRRQRSTRRRSRAGPRGRDGQGARRAVRRRQPRRRRGSRSRRSTASISSCSAPSGARGRRKGWLSNIHLGARDPSDGEFVMLGKTFKGMTDEMLRVADRRVPRARGRSRRPHRLRAARARRRDRVQRRAALDRAIPAASRCASRASSAIATTRPPPRPTRSMRCAR